MLTVVQSFYILRCVERHLPLVFMHRSSLAPKERDIENVTSHRSLVSSLSFPFTVIFLLLKFILLDYDRLVTIEP